eukprot:scaffold107948_cov54-Phaeocystis_antarctica.AAC.1
MKASCPKSCDTCPEPIDPKLTELGPEKVVIEVDLGGPGRVRLLPECGAGHGRAHPQARTLTLTLTLTLRLTLTLTLTLTPTPTLTLTLTLTLRLRLRLSLTNHPDPDPNPNPTPNQVAHILKLFRLRCYDTNHIFRVDKGFVAQIQSVSPRLWLGLGLTLALALTLTLQ